MNSQEAREFVISASAQGRTYDVLRVALPYIERIPEDTEIRLLGVRHLALLGLFGPGIELVDDRPEVFQEAPELVRTIEPLREQPTGRIDWAELAPTFDQNLAAAGKRFESCATHAQQLRDSVRRLDLYCANDGNVLLSRKVGRAPRRWLPGFINWVKDIREATLYPSDANALCMPYLLEGVAFGHALRKIYDGTSRMFLTYTPAIHLLEPNPAQLAVWLHLDDHRNILRDDRFHLWLGQDGADQFIEYHQAHPRDMAPSEVIRQPGWGPAADPYGAAALKQLEDWHGKRTARARQATVDKLASRRNPDYYAQRFAKRAACPLRILGLTSRYTTFLQYSMRDIRSAAVELGHEFRLLIEDNDHTPLLPTSFVQEQIEEFLPDLIVLLDHNRKEYGKLYDFPIPYCNWIQDDLPNLFGPGCGEGLHPYDLVVGTIGNWKANASGYPPDQWLNLPTPVSLGIFSNEPIPQDQRRRYECDVSFVSHLHTTRDELLKQTLSQTSDPLMRRLIEAQYERLGPQIAEGSVPGSPVQVVAQTQRLAGELGFEMCPDAADQLRRCFTDRLINSYFREQILEWASELGVNLHIYGRGWERHPKLSKHARGVAEHGAQLRCIYQASRINIQAVPTGAVHQRLLEGLCAGGFFAIRRTPTDALGRLHDRIMRRCIHMNIRTNDELWNTADGELARDVRTLNDALYAPSQLYDGFVADMYVIAERGHSLQGDVLLPGYRDVAFGTRNEFENILGRFLEDPDARQVIAESQRQVVAEIFSYRAVLERILDFAHRRFAQLAEKQACPAGVR